MKEISVLNLDNSPVKKSKYVYRYEEDTNGDGINEVYSYGKRMSQPSYSRYEEGIMYENNHYDYLICTSCLSFVRTANSVTSLSTSAQGSIVGYSKVIEYVTDSTGGTSLGKTEYSYENTKDVIGNYITDVIGNYVTASGIGMKLPGLLNMTSNRNGLLKEKAEYALVNGMFKEVQRIFNVYKTIKSQTYYNIKYILPLDCQSGTYPTLYTIFFYPSLRSERIAIDSTYTILYNQQDTNKKVSTIQKYFYENEAHTQPTRIATSTSDGKWLITSNKNPLDHIDNLSAAAQEAKDSLVARHIIAPVLEQTITKGSTLVSKTITNYKLFSSGLVLPENLEMQQSSGPLERRVEFQAYDANANLLQQAKVSDISMSYVYGYNKSLPIAEVQNATYDRVAYTGFETDSDKGYWSYTGTAAGGTAGEYGKTGKRYYNLSSGGLAASLPGGTYRLSYWSKSGIVTVSGGTVKHASQSLADANGWVLYEKLVTLPNLTTVTISGTGHLDEVRLHPADAQMTTYTYGPLVGMTSATDLNNVTIYYEYDALGRLQHIRDQDGNILKSYKYHYRQ